MVIFENDLNRKDGFATTRTFPFFLLELPKLALRLRTFQKVFALAPHLVQPRKVIYSGRRKNLVLKSHFADIIYGHSYHQNSKFLTKKAVAEIGFLKSEPTGGVVFQEYTFNISRFFIELLKFFASKGGVVKVEELFRQENNKLIFSNNEETSFREIEIGGVKSRNGYLLPVETFESFSLVTSEKNIHFRFSEQGDRILAEQIEYVKFITEEEILKICRRYFAFELKNAKKVEVTELPSVQVLSEIISVCGRPLPSSFEIANLDNQYETGLEKFDLAKQTGISYDQFIALFHRYGKGIDEMTETAYLLLNEIRDPREIWKQAETKFQQKYEWKKEIK